MPFSALPSQFFKLILFVSLSFSPLLLDLTKTTHELPSRRSPPPKVKPNSRKKKKKTAVQLHRESSPWPKAGLSHFHSLDGGESFRGEAVDEMDWPVEMKRKKKEMKKKKKRREKIIHVSHIVSLGRKKGGRERESVRQTELLILRDDVSKWISFGASAPSVYILHTHRSALNWLWTCAVSFFI